MLTQASYNSSPYRVHLLRALKNILHINFRKDIFFSYFLIFSFCGLLTTVSSFPYPLVLVTLSFIFLIFEFELFINFYVSMYFLFVVSQIMIANGTTVVS